MDKILLASLLFLGSSLCGAARADDPVALGRGAHDLLQRRCAACHGQGGQYESLTGDILDLSNLLSQGYVKPRDSAESYLFQRVARGEMPPRNPLPADEVQLLRSWIDAGAPDADGHLPQQPGATTISFAAMLGSISQDLAQASSADRPFLRYLTLAHLKNQGVSDAGLGALRSAVSKLVNSLSWIARITAPKPVDPAGTVLRLDLRDYGWDAALWNSFAASYPYFYSFPEQNAALGQVRAATGAQVPFVRADWFLAQASQPPLYHQALGIPATAAALEAKLGVDTHKNLRQNAVVRAGFNGSGVSQNNRVIERDDSPFGAYWRSFDFRSSLDLENIFQNPLGPDPADFPEGSVFRPAGGEIIFNLPNGLQGYMLVARAADGSFNRIDKAPIEIVSDPGRPDRAVVNGLSCMSCHSQGMIPKDDQVRAYAQQNGHFSDAYLARILAIYPAADKFKDRMDGDLRRFGAALQQLAIDAAAPDPINQAVGQYEAEVDKQRALAELDLSEAEIQTDAFAEKLRESELLSQLFSQLNLPHGTVKRQFFEQSFPGFMADLGRVFVPVPLSEDTLRKWAPVGTLEPARGASMAVVSPDGRLAALANGDVTIWNLHSRKKLLELIDSSSSSSVSFQAVAFSPDSRFVLAGGENDDAIALYDLRTGSLVRKFLANVDTPISGIAYFPDGQSALVTGNTRAAVVDLRAFTLKLMLPNNRFLRGAALSSDGKKIALSGDVGIALLDAQTGGYIDVLGADPLAGTSIAFSPDGSELLVGNIDGLGSPSVAMRLLDTATLRLVREFPSPFVGKGSTSVAFSPDGLFAFSGTSDGNVLAWNVGTGELVKNLGKVDPGTTGLQAGITSLALTPSGSLAVVGQRTGKVTLLGETLQRR